MLQELQQAVTVKDALRVFAQWLDSKGERELSDAIVTETFMPAAGELLGVSEEALQAEWQEGYDEGYEMGYDEGWDAAKERYNDMPAA